MPEDVKDPIVSPIEETVNPIDPIDPVDPLDVDDPNDDLPDDDAGAKTDSTLLLKSLREERIKRREAERLLAERNGSGEPSEEGQVLQTQIDELKEERDLNKAVQLYPALKAKLEDFQDFKIDYPGVAIDIVAKIFLAEHDMLPAPVQRKGLERPGGGMRQALKEGMTAEDVADLRQNNFRKYSRLVKEGKIQVKS